MGLPNTRHFNLAVAGPSQTWSNGLVATISIPKVSGVQSGRLEVGDNLERVCVSLPHVRRRVIGHLSYGIPRLSDGTIVKV